MLEVFINIKELYLEVTNEDFDSFQLDGVKPN